MSEEASTYKRVASRSPLQDPDMLCDLMRDQLGNMVMRSALEAWLAHPRTVRFMERLRFTPGHHLLWNEMIERIALARETAIEDRPADCAAAGPTIDQAPEGTPHHEP